MDVRALGEAAVRAGQHVLGADQARRALEALGDQLRVLDDVGGVADHARREQLAVGQLDVLPDAPLVLVARVGVLVEVGAGVDLEDEGSTSRSAMSFVCGPFQLPQQTW